MLVSLSCATCAQTAIIKSGTLNPDIFEVTTYCPRCKAVYRITVNQLRPGDQDAKRDPNLVTSTYLPDGTAVPVHRYSDELKKFVDKLSATEASLLSESLQSPKGSGEGEKVQSGS